MITRVELNIAALGALLLLAVHLMAQPAWAGETQAPSPLPSKPAQEPAQADVPSSEGELADLPLERRLGPLARRLHEIIFSDDSRRIVPQSALHLDQLLHSPEWLHLGLDFRTRYEAYSQPVKKNETTGGAQYSERTDVQIGIRYKPCKFHMEFLDARPLYNYGISVSSRMEDRTDLLQLYGSLDAKRLLEVGKRGAFKEAAARMKGAPGEPGK